MSITPIDLRVADKTGFPEMVDVMDAGTRSALMSRIQAKNTKPELIVRRQLWRYGYRFHLHGRKLPGKPDIVLPKWKAVVFVHGCFWHRHEGCPHFRLPKTRTQFWDDKLRRNRERDTAAVVALGEMHWRVAIVWECSIRANHIAAVEQLSTWLRAGSGSMQIEVLDGVMVQEPIPTATG
ncbi:very short patch repair endonuclease [Stenotrophomonas pictorum]